MHETGNRNVRGASGETGRAQWIPGRWEASSKQYIGYTAPMTEINEHYVVAKWAETLIQKGYSDYEIAIRHNRPDGKKVKGVNKFGASYDSDAYAKKVVERLK